MTKNVLIRLNGVVSGRQSLKPFYVRYCFEGLIRLRSFQSAAGLLESLPNLTRDLILFFLTTSAASL